MTADAMPSSERAQALRQFLIATSERRAELPGTKWQGNPSTGPAGAATTDTETSAQPVSISQFDLTADGAVETDIVVLRLPPAAKECDIESGNAALPVMTAAQRLSTLIHYAIAPLTFSPSSLFGQHRPHGSGGGRFAVATELLLYFRGDWQPMRWSPLHQALEVGSTSGAIGPPPQRDRLRMQLVAQHGLLAKSYGAFGFWLSCLECGMIAAQWSLMADLLGYHDIRLQIAPKERSADAPWTDIVVLSIEATDPDIHTVLDEAVIDAVATMRPKTDPWLAENLPFLPQLFRAWHASDSPQPLHCERHADRSFPLMQATQRRSSGVSSEYVRLIHGLLPDHADQWLKAAQDLFAATPFASADLTVSVLIRTGAGQSPQAFRWLSAQQTLEAVELSEAARGVIEAWFADNSAMIITVGADIQPAVSAGTVPHFAKLLLETGAWTHCLALVAARHGAAARALKAVPDNQAGLLFPLSVRPLLQLYIGYEDRPNTLFPI